jgi:(E)-4-hydroxy-3-methylbut-2-enyl-diphosphate synthase
MTSVANIGRVKIGGNNPVAIKGMLKTPLHRIDDVIAEIKGLEACGAQAVRIAVKEPSAAKICGVLKQYVKIPLVADIHFQYKLAMLAIDEGFDSVRLNPLNVSKRQEVIAVAKYATKNKVSIRVGVNSGGFKKVFKTPAAQAKQMVDAAGNYLKILESVDFFNTMVSLKGADVNTTILANQMFAKKYNYPLHLGVTATGPYEQALIKSAIGVGSLLFQGIGNVIRISLSAPSNLEIKAAQDILQALDLRRFGPELISCPTCSRCEVNLIDIVKKFERELKERNFIKPLKIAMMGCVVNGPGEACQADVGAAFGKGKAAIFRRDKIIGWSNEAKIIDDLLKEANKL